MINVSGFQLLRINSPWDTVSVLVRILDRAKIIPLCSGDVPTVQVNIHVRATAATHPIRRMARPRHRERRQPLAEQCDRVAGCRSCGGAALQVDESARRQSTRDGQQAVDFKRRRYMSREHLLRDHGFDSDQWISRNGGLIEWTEEAPQAIRKAVANYFAGRREDS